MVHWGDENTPLITERQREPARWLVNEGVDVVAGSHPHCLQPLDFYQGRPIAYSLGNFGVDGAPTLPRWSDGELLEISVGSTPAAISVGTIRIPLDRRGFPQAGTRTLIR